MTEWLQDIKIYVNHLNVKPRFLHKCQADFENKLGTPDLMVVFTNTCSHKMVQRVNQRSAKYDIPVARIHSASVSALKNVLNQYCI